MPANLPAEAKAKWLKVMEARSPEEKLRALEEFLSAVPKHKGTSKLRARVRHQMAVLRREIEAKKRKKKSGGPKFFVSKEGVAQVILVGLTNSGKSILLKTLTNANPQVSEEPFCTKTPVPGMLQYEGVDIQVVEAPALVEGASRGAMWGAQTLALIKNADFISLLVDLSYDPRSQLKALIQELSYAGVLLIPKKFKVSIEKRKGSGVSILGLSVEEAERLREALEDLGLSDIVIKVSGEVGAEQVMNAIMGYKFKPAVVIGTKYDIGKENYSVLKEECRKIGLKTLPFYLNIDKEYVKRELFNTVMNSLRLIRVYTKSPRSRDPDPRPIILEEGATVLDLAKNLHSRLYKGFRYAKVWSSRFRFNPQRVGAKFPLGDGDIVEIII